jgi:hypothetical protein
MKLLIKESLSMREKFEQFETGVYFTDFVGDIVNLMLNKPKIYRIVYDSQFDTYAMCDAKIYIHDNLAELLFDSGFVQQFMNNYDIEEIKNCPKVPVGTDAQRYRVNGSWIKHTLNYAIFVPYDKNNGENKLDSWYRYCLPIESGNIYVHEEEELSDSRAFKDLYTKLISLKAIL